MLLRTESNYSEIEEVKFPTHPHWMQYQWNEIECNELKPTKRMTEKNNNDTLTRSKIVFYENC